MDITHYVPAFAARGICGAIGPHATEPSCPECRQRLESESDYAINTWLDGLPASSPPLFRNPAAQTILFEIRQFATYGAYEDPI